MLLLLERYLQTGAIMPSPNQWACDRYHTVALVALSTTSICDRYYTVLWGENMLQTRSLSPAASHAGPPAAENVTGLAANPQAKLEGC
jgi:hypothetical protein